MVWASFHRVKDGFALPDFLWKAILAEEHVDIRIVDMPPRLFTLLLVIQENVQDPGMSLLEGSVIV